MNYTHPLLFPGLYLAVPQIGGVVPRIKMYHSDLSVGSSIRTAKNRNSLWVEGETRSTTYRGVSAKKRKKLTSRKALSFFGRGDGGDDLLVDFCSSQRSNPTPTEKRDEYTVFDIEVAVIEYF